MGTHVSLCVHRWADGGTGVKDFDKIGMNDFEGQVTVPVAVCSGKPNEAQDMWLPLVGKKGKKDKNRGELHILLKFIGACAASACDTYTHTHARAHSHVVRGRQTRLRPLLPRPEPEPPLRLRHCTSRTCQPARSSG